LLYTVPVEIVELKRALAEYIYYRSFHAEISDLYDAIIISMHNSAQLNVDIYVVTLYGRFAPFTNVSSVYPDIKTR